MKLFHYFKREDFGTEYCFSLFRTKKYSLIQFSFSWNDFPSRPSLILYLGLNSLLNLMITLSKFGFCLEILGLNWIEDSLSTDLDITFHEDSVL